MKFHRTQLPHCHQPTGNRQQATTTSPSSLYVASSQVIRSQATNAYSSIRVYAKGVLQETVKRVTHLGWSCVCPCVQRIFVSLSVCASKSCVFVRCVRRGCLLTVRHSSMSYRSCIYEPLAHRRPPRAERQCSACAGHDLAPYEITTTVVALLAVVVTPSPFTHPSRMYLYVALVYYTWYGIKAGLKRSGSPDRVDR